MISYVEIETTYREKFRVSGWRCLGSPFFFADTKYAPANLDLIKQVILLSEVDSKIYIPDEYDCDDFVFELMGDIHANSETCKMPIFITWLIFPSQEPHAIVTFYLDSEIHCIDPQTDRIWGLKQRPTLKLLCG